MKYQVTIKSSYKNVVTIYNLFWVEELKFDETISFWREKHPDVTIEKITIKPM